MVPAYQGKLTVLASGQKEAYERALPYLEKLAARIFYLGEPVLATRMKLVNSLLASTVKEMYAMTYSRGEEKLDFSALYRILTDGP